MVTREDIEYDMTGLNEFVSALHGALYANGEDGDIHRVLKTEAGQLAWDISNSLGPASQHERDKKAEGDVKRFLTDTPAYSNLSPEQQYSSISDFTWLQAGPHFLLGINDEDNQVGVSADDAMSFLRGGQAAGNSRGKAYVELGKRGKQHIYRLNRTRVSQSALSSVMRSIKRKFGTLRASFAYTAAQLIPNKRIPAWISRHFDSKANGRAIFNESGLTHHDNPYIEFGSTSPGVESNPTIVDRIDAAVKVRQKLVESKVKKVIAGYSYDWETGRVFHRREAQQEDG